MADPVYGSPEAQQEAVDDMCVAISRAEVDLEKALIAIGKLPGAIKEFRTYIAKHVVMMGNFVDPLATAFDPGVVKTFYRPACRAADIASEAMDDLRALHLQLECFRVACGLPAPALGALAGGGGGKG